MQYKYMIGFVSCMALHSIIADPPRVMKFVPGNPESLSQKQSSDQDDSIWKKLYAICCDRDAHVLPDLQELNPDEKEKLKIFFTHVKRYVVKHRDFLIDDKLSYEEKEKQLRKATKALRKYDPFFEKISGRRFFNSAFLKDLFSICFKGTRPYMSDMMNQALSKWMEIEKRYQFNWGNHLTNQEFQFIAAFLGEIQRNPNLILFLFNIMRIQIGNRIVINMFQLFPETAFAIELFNNQRFIVFLQENWPFTFIGDLLIDLCDARIEALVINSYD